MDHDHLSNIASIVDIVDKVHESSEIGRRLSDAESHERAVHLPTSSHGYFSSPSDSREYFESIHKTSLDYDSSGINIKHHSDDCTSHHEDYVVPKAEQPEAADADDPNQYPKPLALLVLMLGICIAVFLLALDRTIVTTAIPTITNEFHSYQDVGWYGSAYLITSCAFQPLFGRLFQMMSVRGVFLTSVAIFEIGSLVCALAPNSNALIAGRAVAGFGSAGVLSGAFTVAAHSVPLPKRPAWMGAVGMFFSIGSIVGPLIGGLFTSLASHGGWRWCFWINLPVGALTIITCFFFLKPTNRGSATRSLDVRKVLNRIDIPGNMLLLGSAVMFFLALQFANNNIPWRSARIIGLLAGAAAGIIIFTGWQFLRKDNALIPPRIALQRSVAFGCLTAFFLYGSLLLHNYYLPIWFQAIKNRDALQSGIDMLALVVPTAIASLVGGILVSKIGYFTPVSITGCAIATVGAGLVCTLSIDISAGKWIGYLILTGFGLGISIQQGFNAAHTVLSLEDIPIGSAAVTFAQSLGGSVFVSVGDTILIKGLSQAKVPGLDVQEIVYGGATGFVKTLPQDEITQLLNTYNDSLRRVFICATILYGLSFLTSCGMEFRSVKKSNNGHDAKAEA